MGHAIGGVVFSLLMLVFAWVGRRRVARAFRTEAHCVVCEGTDLTVLAPAVYRCNACGHEGGEGIAAGIQARREAAFREMSPAQRRKSARRDLLEARTLLLSGLADLERAGSWLAFFTDRRSGQRADQGETDGAFASGMGLLLEARAKARDAQVKLGVSLGVAATADLGDHVDGRDVLVDDLQELRHVGRFTRNGRAMLRAVEAMLSSLGS